MRLRAAQPADAFALSALAQHIYRQTFTHYHPADLEQFLSLRYNSEVFAAYMQDATNRLWLAEQADKPIAYALFGHCHLPIAHPPSARELQRLYVHPEYQHQGIGQQLMAEVLNAAAEEKACSIYLGVWEKNIQAQRFYQRYGFEKIVEYSYPPIGQVVDCEWIMRKEL